MHASMASPRCVSIPAPLSSSSSSSPSCSSRRMMRCRSAQFIKNNNNTNDGSVSVGGRQRRRGSPVVVHAAAADDDPFKGFSLEKLAKKVQGAIPVVSLLSKLLTPEGGIGSESLSYNEYCRAKLDAAGGTAYGASLSELCDLHAVEPRQLLLLTWMVYEGNGLLSGDLALGAARRMSSTGFDYEYEIYRFEQARDAALGAMKKKGAQRSRETTPAVRAAAEVLELCCGAKNGLTAEGKRHIAVVAEATMTPV